MKKRILIVSHGLEIGGAESSLIGYLQAFADNENVEADLFLYKHSGELMKYIPKGINLLPENSKYACLAIPIKNVIRKGHIFIAAGRALGKQKAKVYRLKNKLAPEKCAVGIEYSHKYTRKLMPMISNTEYDLAVSFLTPHYFVAEKVKAKKKVAFIHTDYSYITVDAQSELKMWDQYDNIAAVSEVVKISFDKLFPPLARKVVVIENIAPTVLIKARANEFIPYDEMPDDGCIKILSIGRFCDAKNFESIPHKAEILKELGISFKWYIIGFGDDSLIRQAIDETKTQNEVIILGKKTNPYPYIKRCDIYAQPSRYEGKAVTVLEAQILSKPVIISNYTTASSQLQDGIDGIIAPRDNEGFIKSLCKLINDNDYASFIAANCRQKDFSNSLMADKLVKLA